MTDAARPGDIPINRDTPMRFKETGWTAAQRSLTCSPMVLDIVKYGNPVLRRKGARVAEITPEVRRLIDDMLETMEAAQGVGLAAQQVGRALQVTVIDVSGVTDRPSTIEVGGEAGEIPPHMPLVLINPEIEPFGQPVGGPEGCLSFPEIYAEIVRPESVTVKALDREGQVTEFRAGGLLARAIQHEVDHLNGLLFIDRMAREDKDSFRAELDALQKTTKEKLK
jgi:peptide deformylase